MSRTIRITTKLAEEFLFTPASHSKNDKRNRKEHQRRVEAYADAILQGQWRVPGLEVRDGHSRIREINSHE